MPTPRKTLVSGLVLVALSLAVLYAFSSRETASQQAGPGKGGGPPPTPVEIEVTTKREIIPTASLLGSAEAARRSVVAAAIEGYVVAYPTDEGDDVREGDELAALRDEVLRLRLREAKGALKELHELHRKARLDLDRARKLQEREAVPQKTLDEAVSAERALSLRIPQAEVRVAILETDIAKKIVRAPFAGQVVREHTEEGEWLALGAPVATIVDLTKVYVRVGVPERQIRFVQVDQEVDVLFRAASETGQPISGRVASVSGDGDGETRTFPVRVEIDNVDGMLRAGMSARVELPAGPRRHALAVHKDAVLMQGGASSVYVVDQKGLAASRVVQLGVASRDRFEVTGGLEAGDRVIVRGNERVRPGMPVRAVGAVGAAAEASP